MYMKPIYHYGKLYQDNELKKGCILSLILFNIVLDEAVKQY